MPTPECAKAFAKHVAARTHLNEVTRLLNESHERGSRQRYDQLQAEWDMAYKEFQAATAAVSVTVKKLPEIVVALTNHASKFKLRDYPD